MRTLLLSSILVVTACCTSREAKVVPVAGETLKPGAPTELESQVSGQRAKLTLRFARPGENVTAVVSGLDGVKVTSSAELMSGAVVKPGEARVFEVAFEGQGHLVIDVRGIFGGAEQARVHTVKVGEAVPQVGTRQVTDDGDAVKLLP